MKKIFFSACFLSFFIIANGQANTINLQKAVETAIKNNLEVINTDREFSAIIMLAEHLTDFNSQAVLQNAVFRPSTNI